MAMQVLVMKIRVSARLQRASIEEPLLLHWEQIQSEPNYTPRHAAGSPPSSASMSHPRWLLLRVQQGEMTAQDVPRGRRQYGDADLLDDRAAATVRLQLTLLRDGDPRHQRKGR